MLGQLFAEEIFRALDTHEASLHPSLEGARDYRRVADPRTTPDETALQNEAERIAGLDERRIGLLLAVRTALGVTLAAIAALEADGFPARPSYAVSEAALAQMEANADTITAALARAQADRPRATAGRFTLGAGVAKPPAAPVPAGQSPQT